MITTGQLSIRGESYENDGPLFIRSQSVVSRVVAGETLIVPVRGKVGDLASIYNFNRTGSLIWKLLETPRSMNELVTEVAQEFDVDRERAADQLRRAGACRER